MATEDFSLESSRVELLIWRVRHDVCPWLALGRHVVAATVHAASRLLHLRSLVEQLLLGQVFYYSSSYRISQYIDGGSKSISTKQVFDISTFPKPSSSIGCICRTFLSSFSDGNYIDLTQLTAANLLQESL